MQHLNNILTVLNVMLKKAVEWDVIERLPCTIKVLPVSKGSTQFYDFDEFERLATAAKTTDPRAYVLVMLAGEAEGQHARSRSPVATFRAEVWRPSLSTSLASQ